jgi:hypothetical protein
MKDFHYKPRFWVPSITTTFILVVLLGGLIPNRIAAQSCILACNDLVVIAVPANGSTEFLPLDIAEGDLSLSCPNGNLRTQVQINAQWLPASGNMVFNETHIGQTLPARVVDQVSGNSCWGNVQVVQAPTADTIHFKLCTELWKDKRPIKGTTLLFQPVNPAFPYSPFVFALDSSQSCADATIVLNDYLPGTRFSYGAILTDTGGTNGIDIRDLCEVSHHVLGIASLPSPYAIIAADANKSGSVTTFDIVESKKLILGVYTEFPNNTEWRQFPDYCQFSNPLNPFQGICLPDIDLSQLMALDGDTARIIAVKIGDVNGDVRLNNEPYVPPGSTDSITIILPQGPIIAGVDLAVPVKLDKDFLFGGIQINFQLKVPIAKFDSLSVGALSFPIQGQSISNFNQTTGRFQVAILADQTMGAINIPAGETLFYIHLKTTQNAQLEDILKVVTNDPDSRTFGMGPNCLGYYHVNSDYSGSVGTSSPKLLVISVHPPSPNPFSAQSFLEVDLESAESGLLEVVDLMGRIVFSEARQLAPGMNRLEIPASAVASGSLGIWRLRVGAQVVSGKLVRR